jgi:hypothetical protein
LLTCSVIDICLQMIRFQQHFNSRTFSVQYCKVIFF